MDTENPDCTDWWSVPWVLDWTSSTERCDQVGRASSPVVKETSVMLDEK